MSTTDDAATMVCGRVAGGPVDAVFVNGHSARSEDGYRNWVCEVPLDPGFNDIAIECIESGGGRIVEDGPRVYRGDTRLGAPTDAVAYAGGIAVLDLRSDSIRAYDIDSGAGTVISGQGVGSGVEFSDPALMAVSPDERTAVVFDRKECRVIEVDLATGDRTLISETTVSGPDVVVRGSLSTDGAYAYLMDRRSLVGVKLWNGHRETVWRALPPPCSTGTIGIGAVAGVALDPVTSKFVVADSEADQLMTISATGQHELVSAASPGASIARSHLIAVTPRRSAVVVGTEPDTLLEIDLRNGVRRVIRITPNAIQAPASIASIADHVVVTEPTRGLVHRVELATGKVETVLSDELAGGVRVRELAPTIAVDGGGALVVERSTATVVGVNYETGRRDRITRAAVGFEGSAPPLVEVIDGAEQAILLGPGGGIVRVDLDDGTSSTLGGGSIHRPAAVRVDETHNRGIVLDTFASTGSIVSIDLDTGAHEVLATAPPGPRVFDFGDTGGLALCPDGDTAYIARPDAVLEKIDLATGARTAVQVVGPRLIAPTDAVYDPVGRCVLVLDEGRHEIVAVDPLTGESRTVSGPGRGGGPAFETPRSIAVDPLRNVAHVIDGNRVLAIELETGTRVLTVR